MKIIKDNHLPQTTPNIKILNKVIEFYHNTLLQDQKARNQLKAFNISQAIIVQHKLGLADGSLLKTIPEKGPILESLKQAGVLNEQGKEIFLDCLILPELDQEGNAVKLIGKQLASLTSSELAHLVPKEQTATQCGHLDESIEPLKDGLFIRYGERKYLIRGIDNSNHRQLKVNIKAVNQSRFHIDSIDLYLAKQRKVFAKETALLFHAEAEATEADLNRIIERTEKYLESKKESAAREYAITDKDRERALKFLKSPDLIKQTLRDFETIGCAGEETNKIMGYLAAISRKLDDPLSLLILSRSAAGKSTLQDSILELVPEEERSKYTRITGQALFYKGENSLQHKLIAIEEEEGAHEAAYSIRTMQSSKYLTIATTIKDPLTGQMKTQEYTVKGPLSIILTTTRNDIDPETMSRFIVLTIDESKEQTRLIHNLQRQQDTLEGLLRTVDKESVIKKHHNAQRLLRPLKVVNPYAGYLSFADDRLRTRRDHKKYLNLIKAITFLHQYQREVKSIQRSGKTIEYIEVTLDDIRFANILADEIFGKSLDELSPPSRRLLKLIEQLVKQQAQAQGILPQEARFSRRDIREYTKWSDHQVRDHLAQLVDLEYVLIVSGRNGSRYTYQLLYDGRGDTGEKFYIGLTDMKTLRDRANSAYAKASADKLAVRKPDLAPSLPLAYGRLADNREMAKR
jgi:hypothetical protein